MKFIGNNYLSLSDQTGLNFNLNISVSNLSGNCNLGFYGQGEDINFKFDQGKIYDPENRIVYFYAAEENINLSGNISPTNYSYNINNNPFCLNGFKNSFTINEYYVETSNCSVECDIQILGTRPNYTLNLNPIFYITGTNYIEGNINNSNNLTFKIYSGSISIPTGFNIKNISTNITNTGYFTINHYSYTKNQIEEERAYPIQVNLFTNFGQITQDFISTGSYSGYKNITLTLSDLTDYFSRTGITTGLGDFQNNNFLLNFNILSGSLRMAPTELDKYLSLKLEYYGGKTGVYDYNVFATGYLNDTITGFISGSGILEKTISFIGTGYDDISGIIKTGLTTGIIKDIFFSSGFSSQNINITYSGYIDNYLITLNSGFDISGISSNGFLNYYTYLYKNVYNSTTQFSGNDLSENDNFGHSIAATSGKMIIIGSPGTNVSTYNDVGSIYIFTGNSNYYNQVIKITGNNAKTGDGFGTSLATTQSGNIIYIGATGRRINNITGGAVYIFTGNSLINSWTQNRMITGIDPSGFDSFGYSLASNRNNSVLVIGAPNKNISNLTGVGSAYIFTGDGISAWGQWSGKITGSDSLSGDNFGYSIAVSNTAEQIIIGAPHDDIGTYSNAGSVYIFSGNGVDTWGQSVKITGGDTLTNDGFGNSIALNSNATIIAIGSTGNSSSQGAVYIFTGNGTNSWVQRQKISAFDATNNDRFGHSLKMTQDGTKIIVGAYGDSNDGGLGAGSIYIFTGNGLSWAHQSKIIPSYLNAFQRFGASLTFCNNESSIAVGIPSYNDPGTTLNDIGSVQIIDYPLLSGFVGQIIATGLISQNSNYFATGNISGNSFNKKFLDTFNLLSGFYSSGLVTGLTDFSNNNFIQNGYYTNSGMIQSGLNNLYLQVKTKNYLDNNLLTGKLTISGYTLDGKKSSVIIQYITGVN